MKSDATLIPFVPTPEEKVEIIMKFSQVKPGQRTIDLGAGDGRIVIAMAKAGAEAHGFEIREKYVRRAKFNIAKENLVGMALIHQSDFWEEDLSSYDIITIYGMVTIMDRLEEKLSKEAKPGAIVISNGFPIPGWKILKLEDHIHYYLR